MGKYEGNKKKAAGKWILVICLVLLIGILALHIVPQLLYTLGSGQEPEDPSTVVQGTEVAVAEPVDAVEFPVTLEDGRIEIESLFRYSGVNPDCGKQDADDVAAIVLKNMSDTYLDDAKVTAVLADGSELVFHVADVPAGKAAMAFSVENDELLASDFCVDIAAEAVFEEQADADTLEVRADGMTITLKNPSQEEQKNIVVYYRDVFDDKYFGGMAYTHTIENLAAGETLSFDAGESLLGLIEVVRVTVNEKN